MFRREQIEREAQAARLTVAAYVSLRLVRREMDEMTEAARTSSDPRLSQAILALDHAEALGMAPLEFVLAGFAARDFQAGETEEVFLDKQRRLLLEAPLEELPFADAPNRLTQVVETLRTNGLWPWA